MMALKLKKKSKFHTILIIFIIAICLSGFLYMAGALYFSRHFFPNTIINGQKAGNRSAATIKERLTKDITGHDLTLIEREEKTEIIEARDIGVKLDYKNLVHRAVVLQNQWTWPREIFEKHEIHLEPEMMYDEDLLEEKIEELDVMKPKEDIPPKDARIILKDDKFYIVREKKGNQLKKKTFRETVKSYVDKSETTLDLEKEKCYNSPKYYADDKKVRDALKKAKKYAASSIFYELDGENKILDNTEINQWISVDSDMKVSLDEDKITEYVAKLASEYNTVGQPINFINHSGESMLIGGGTFGYEIDEEKEVQKIVDDIKEGKNITRSPVYSHEPPSSSSTGYWSTYVEINIAQQHMWMVKNGQEIVSTDVVTGDVTKGHGTPTGAYYIFYKERNATLKGQGYASPVSYWAAFNNNVGIHDASWRKTYGGTIYQGSGSHGCINTPYSNAKTIWENVELGTPVFVY